MVAQLDVVGRNPSGSAQEQPESIALPEQRPLYFYLKSSIGYIALAAFVVIVIMTSDMPFLSFIPGKQYITDLFSPYLNSVVSPLKAIFSSAKMITIPLMIVVSAGLFYIVDQLISRKAAA